MVDATEGGVVNGGDRTAVLRSAPNIRLLALEVRPQKFGFAVFEGPTRLLDWGVRNLDDKEDHLAVPKKISSILDLHTPTMVVMRERRDGSLGAKKMRGLIVRAIREETKRRTVELHLVGTRTVRRFFVEYKCETKHQIASLLAEWFEDLAWKLPPKRRPWDGEHHNSVIFDAAAVGVTFFAQAEGNKDSSSNNSSK